MSTVIRHRLRLSPKLLLYSFPKPSFLFSTTTSDSVSFTISYLTNTCGFTPEAALKLSKRLRFNTAQKPDSVISFFQTHGFSAPQIHRIFSKCPELMVCDPTRRLLPKFHFLTSKGVSASDVVSIVTRNPRFLCSSFENCIFPTFQLLRRFFPSDLRALTVFVVFPSVIGHCRLASNIERLLNAGVAHVGIRYLLNSRSFILCSNLRTLLEEVKLLGFDPLKVTFTVALQAKSTVSNPLWDAKVDVLKKWGWSEDEVLVAFRKHPAMMLCSMEKLDAVTRFWVGRLGWDRSELIAYPWLFSYSLDKRLVPRALVLQYLLSRGLVKKDGSISTPFCNSDEEFLKKYVKSFKEETPWLLELYQKGQGAS
ncbi:transcription termination factor MTERF5, chloroplastic-like [Vigna radiata var. radiata]|uniref:Transcription termination factor MTERF5, chloroplastic-like n=1 Tax=Vigna radiata var. radiata TaxID=3916 RepID=A0A1S3UD02_VIGRR|nr:transcription termination factor MTERF5, chloroplastic-like [Vigna radiata var. radiata]